MKAMITCITPNTVVKFYVEVEKVGDEYHTVGHKTHNGEPIRFDMNMHELEDDPNSRGYVRTLKISD